MNPKYSRPEHLALRRDPGLQHPAFGDLSRLDAVPYPEPTFPLSAVAEHSPYMVHISVTGRCNARCRGCVNSAITLLGAEQLPADVEPERDSRAVAALLRDAEDTDVPFADLADYARRYEADYGRILEDYIGWLGRGEVPPIPHLNELILYLLTGRERGMSACGVEVDRNYDILGGRIHACADLPLGWAIGSIADDGTPTVREADLMPLVTYKADLGCDACGVHGYCGGRCPVQGMTAQARRLLDYCQLMRLHVGLACQALPRIREALDRGGVTPQRIYDESGVYAQFTDVTP